MKILFVDDEDGIRTLVSKVLRAKGFDVVVAPSGAAALETYENASPPFSLLIVDIGLPDMPGHALASRIRATSPALPVLFLSGLAPLLSDVDLCERTRVLTKPFELPRLLAAVKELLNTAPTDAEKVGPPASSQPPGEDDDRGQAQDVKFLFHQLMNKLNLACGFSELLAETTPANLSKEEAVYLKETQSALRRAVQIAEKLQVTVQDSRVHPAPGPLKIQ